jgi:steroid delta-isomerase-like uncharacterized protein
LAKRRKDMSTEQNKANQLRVWEEAFNRGEMAVIDEFFAPDYVFRSPLGMEAKGPESFKQMVAGMRSALPDLHVTVDDILADGDKVVTRFAFTGTFNGELMGIAPTGKKLNVTGMLISRWRNGREVQAWESLDTLAFYQQLGIRPPGL